MASRQKIWDFTRHSPGSRAARRDGSRSGRIRQEGRMTTPHVNRPTLADLDLSTGKRTRLHRLLYKYGPGNGTLLLLPIDQGLEHGPRDFFVNPAAKDPEFQLRLAKDGGFSGIVFQYGIAEKYMSRYAGEVPLVLKLNGKTEIPSDKAPISP